MAQPVPPNGAGDRRRTRCDHERLADPAQLLATIEISAGNANQFSRYREMWRNGTDSSHALEYNFYTTSNYNVVWSDGSGGSSPQVINQTVATFNAVIFAKLQYQQNAVTAGEYSDTLTVTFNLR